MINPLRSDIFILRIILIAGMTLPSAASGWTMPHVPENSPATVRGAFTSQALAPEALDSTVLPRSIHEHGPVETFQTLRKQAPAANVFGSSGPKPRGHDGRGPATPFILKTQQLLRRGEFEAAREAAQEGLQRYSQNPVLLGLSAIIAAHLNDFGTAIDLAHQTVKRTPHDARAWHVLAHVFFLAGHLEEALEANQIEIEHQPHHAEGYAFRAKVFLSRWRITHEPQDLSNAITDSLTQIGIAPENSAAHAFLSGLYQHQGRLDQAIEEREKELDLVPGDTTARARLFWLYQKYIKTSVESAAFSLAQELLEQASERLKGHDLGILLRLVPQAPSQRVLERAA